MIYENEIIILIDNDYLKVTFHPVKKYLKIEWKEAVKNITTQEAIEYSRKAFRQIEKNHPKYILQDVSKVKFAYTPEYISWVVNELTPRLPDFGVRKIVYVTSNDVMTKIGLELLNSLAQEKTDSVVKRKLTTSVKQGEMWLFKYED